jgi:hypothetical protein
MTGFKTSSTVEKNLRFKKCTVPNLSSIFVNHYYRPDLNEIITKRMSSVLDELMKDLLD